MQRRLLVLAIYDPRWFMKVLELSRRRGVIFNHYYFKERVPYGSVVYTDFEQVLGELADRNDLIVVYDPEKTCRGFEKAVLLTMHITGYRNLVIGIDPGATLSYVVLGDDHLLLYGDGGLRDLSRDLSYVTNCIPHEEIRVRVGAGSRCGEVLEYIKKNYAWLPLELVDEASTSPSRRKTEEIVYSSKRLRGLKPFRHKDIYAAYKIALSKGIEVV